MEGEDDVSGAPHEPGNPLLRAVFLRRLRLTRLLLEGGAYINESDGQGQTPLMVACRTQHVDAQSASRDKLVQYLLERGADLNIQDKSGRTALMHACRGQAGAAVVSLLLASGADPGLEDHSGSSALLYAVTAGDQEVLKLLLDTCKAKGKEVIIITTDTFPCGKPRARQYLNVPPLAPLDQGDGLHPSSAAPPCASPSEIQLLTSPPCSSSSSSTGGPRQVFSFKQSMCSGSGGMSSQPSSPSSARGLGRLDRLQQPLQRLNSEPWLRIPASLLVRQPSLAPSSTEDLRDVEEDLSVKINWLGLNTEEYDKRIPHRCSCSTDQNKIINTNTEDKVGETGGPLRRKLSISSLFSSHSASHPNLHSHSLHSGQGSPSSSTSIGGRDSGCPLPSLAVSSLRNIIQRRHLGADHYSSDPQLASGFPEEGRAPLGSRKLVMSRSSTLLGSRESLEAPVLTRRALSGLERRGSGSLQLDHISQTRPSCLPPLFPHHHHSPIPNISGLGSNPSPGSRAVCGAVAGLKTLLPSAPPGLPKELKTRRMLLRRHSMQTEQIKHLGDFDGIFGH
ncbi:ankyrin repeat domain-containing protein 34B-like [Osmerus mordax]|uniref:ankyrin repeat domain-containing protein 34B-like n=1 Tax=Osmerus mordax TaxID=8014 RepID=UPI0035100177